MLKLSTRSATELLSDSLQDDLATVCRRIPPLWDLPNYVAVNPFLGFSGQPLASAARTISDGLGAQVLPPLAFYRERWQAGAFGDTELAAAAERAGQEPAALQAILDGNAPTPLRRPDRVYSFAEQYDQRHGTTWNSRVLRQITNWCAAAISSSTAETGQLYAEWRAAAAVDRSLEIAGLPGWRAFMQRLPADPIQAIDYLLHHLEVAPHEREAYLYRLLGGVFGWAAYLRRDQWAGGDRELGPLLDLLAIRLSGDAAVAYLAPQHELTSTSPAPAVEDEGVLLIAQEALEDGFVNRLLAGLNPPAGAPESRPALQAAFCIDVRSEVLRRHLEAQSAAIETRGFAGFFGVFLNWQSDGGDSARCPVLVPAGVSIRSRAPQAPFSARNMLKKLVAAPASAFTYVETLGLGYAFGLLGDALGRLSMPRHQEAAVPFENLSGLEDRIANAASILKNLGLRQRYGRIVLLCGHEGRSENNAHQAGLDCGACGGHGGAINARVACALLNDPQVRAALPALGYPVPSDTHFLPGLHITTTDEVQLLDTDQVPASHQADLVQIQAWFAAAAAATQAERAGGLGITDKASTQIERLLQQRANDWSQPRPEWALSRNAAFIVAPRSRTRDVNLEGRAFLHEYDWTSDPDNSILSLILTAPMVVASWINLQYFASTVDNQTFGSGSKALHNRVGKLGVVSGNGGDLRTGLSRQSVHAADGSWYHEPLRLQVIVEAPCERIEAVLAEHSAVRDLVENGWLRLFAIDPNDGTARRRLANQGWVATSR